MAKKIYAKGNFLFIVDTATGALRQGALKDVLVSAGTLDAESYDISGLVGVGSMTVDLADMQDEAGTPYALETWTEFWTSSTGKFSPEDAGVFLIDGENTTIEGDGSEAEPFKVNAIVGDGGGGVSLGETSVTAYRGDRGKTAYDHSQATGNPHGTTADDLVDGTTYKKVLSTEKTAWNGKQDALGFTAEDSANKSTTLDNDKASDVKYSTPKSIYDWAVGLFAPIITALNFGSFVNGLTSKPTPVDADYLGVMDSAASNVQKKLSWANIKATLKTYFDTLYAPASAVTTMLRLSIDQTTTSATAVNVTDLVTTLAPNSSYVVRGMFHIGCDNTGGIKFGASIPSGTMYFEVASRLNTNDAMRWVPFSTSGTLPANPVNTFNNASGGAIIGGTITTGVTGGSFQMIFGCGVAGQTSTIYSEGSFLEIIKVA